MCAGNSASNYSDYAKGPKPGNSNARIQRIFCLCKKEMLRLLADKLNTRRLRSLLVYLNC